MDAVMKRAMLIFAVFLAGCGGDFGPVEEGYRGVFDYKPDAGFSQTITATIEGDLVAITRNDNSTASPSGNVRLGSFHVSSAIGNRYNMIDGASIYVLYNGTERIGYFNSGEKDIFYPGADDSRQDYFIRRGSSAVFEPEEPEEPYYY
jgi:hypothetical protein